MKEIINECGLYDANLIDDMISGYLLNTSNERWICNINNTNELVGLAYYIPEKMTNGTWNILLIAVLPNQQGKGIGGQLITHVINDLKKSGNEHLLLVETSSLPEYEKSRQFYLHRGFHEECRIKDFYQKDEDKVVFTMKLC